MPAPSYAGRLPESIVLFHDIDWQRPWLAPFEKSGQALIRSGDWMCAANEIASGQGLKTASGLPVVFVPQHNLHADVAYEAHIHATGQVPTRNNLHDFFNALVWLHYPHIKKTLNALHAASQASTSAHPDAGSVRSAANKGSADSIGTRGRARDAATLFDENAAFFICSDAQWANALRQHQWPQLLQQSPEDFFSKVSITLFGHALIEKLVTPYKAITAHVWISIVEPTWFALDDYQRRIDSDQRVAAAISQGFASSDFAHLPVLGVPGWWHAQDSDFYTDSTVFRPLRQKHQTPPDPTGPLNG